MERVLKTKAKAVCPQINLYQNPRHSSTLILIIRETTSITTKTNQKQVIRSITILNLMINSRVLDSVLKINPITKTQ